VSCDSLHSPIEMSVAGILHTYSLQHAADQAPPLRAESLAEGLLRPAGKTGACPKRPSSGTAAPGAGRDSVSTGIADMSKIRTDIGFFGRADFVDAAVDGPFEIKLFARLEAAARWDCTWRLRLKSRRCPVPASLPSTTACVDSRLGVGTDLLAAPIICLPFCRRGGVGSPKVRPR